jgi:prolyl oligopeptidase
MKFDLKILSPFLILILSSCASIETTSNLTVNLEPAESVYSQDSEFELFLSDQWEEGMEDSPVFASMLGDKRFNTKISSNSASQFNKDKIKENDNLEKLRAFDLDALSEDNKLNYRLAELGLMNSINRMEYPSYLMELNQRGGVQSYYETGDRLVFLSSQDYEDWLIRLEGYAINISNSLVNNRNGLKLGYTQPKLVTRGVISQIKAIVESDIDKHPYLKVFVTADESLFTNNQKNELIKRAKLLIEQKNKSRIYKITFIFRR